MVAQVDEQHAAVVADAMAPAGQPYVLADVAFAERATGMGAVTVHAENPARIEENAALRRRTRHMQGRFCQGGPQRRSAIAAGAD
jgi:hypothetical protein